MTRKELDRFGVSAKKTGTQGQETLTGIMDTVTKMSAWARTFPLAWSLAKNVGMARKVK